MKVKKVCFSCLQRKEEMSSDGFICTDCVAMSSARASSNMDGRDLIRALRTLGLRHQVVYPERVKQ